MVGPNDEFEAVGVNIHEYLYQRSKDPPSILSRGSN